MVEQQQHTVKGAEYADAAAALSELTNYTSPSLDPLRSCHPIMHQYCQRSSLGLSG